MPLTRHWRRAPWMLRPALGWLVAGGLAAVAGCGGATGRPAGAAPDDLCETVAGDPSSVTLAPGRWDLHGFALDVSEISVDAPAGRAFVLSVAGPSTRRRLVTGGTGSTPCGMRPLPDDPCTEVGIGVFATDLQERIEDIGAVGSTHIDHVEVHDYGELDRAATATADALRAWRIADPFRVEARPVACGILLEGP